MRVVARRRSAVFFSCRIPHLHAGKTGIPRVHEKIGAAAFDLFRGKQFDRFKQLFVLQAKGIFDLQSGQLTDFFHPDTFAADGGFAGSDLFAVGNDLQGFDDLRLSGFTMTAADKKGTARKAQDGAVMGFFIFDAEIPFPAV